MPIVERGSVYRGPAKTDYQCATGPVIVVMPDGRWLCSFRTTPNKGAGDGLVLLAWSGNEGKSWSEGCSHPATAASRAAASSSVSHQMMETWSEPRQLPPFEFDESVTGPTAPLLRLSNGDLAFPIELSKPQGDDAPSRHFAP